VIVDKAMAPREWTGRSDAKEPLYGAGDFAVDESIGYLIKRVRSMLGTAVEREIADTVDSDVTYDQWGVLVAILKGRGDTAAVLSRGVECDSGSMTRMLDRLEAKQLIVRTRSTDDRRRVQIELTTEGKQKAERLVQAIVAVLNRHLEGFSADELALFKSFLRRMLANRDIPC
jgi:DNA-binding MarR family transcriptional regulator